MPRRNGYAEISACGKYRYTLGGELTRGLPIMWVMLNPSTADALEDDATIKTICIFSDLWGFGRIMVGNLYAYRTKHPKILVNAWRNGEHVVGPENDAVLARMATEVRDAGGKIMAAWGAGPKTPQAFRVQHGLRARDVRNLVGRPMYCLKTNGDGSPVHPLYQPHNLTPQPWETP